MKRPGIIAVMLLLWMVTSQVTGPANAENPSGVEDILQNASTNAFGGSTDSETPSTKTGIVRVGTSLNVRRGPWGEIIGSLYEGNVVEIVGEDGEWLKINYNGQIAYVHKAYVQTPETYSNPVEGTVTVSTCLNVRTGPWGTIIGHLGPEDKVEIKGREGDWMIINYNGGTAYIHSAYVRIGPGSGPYVPPGATPVNPPPSGQVPASREYIGSLLEAAAARYNLPPDILKAVAWQESTWRADASSFDGGHGKGVMQIDDRYHAFARTPDVWDPVKNIDYGARFLADLLRQTGDMTAALRRYNGSPSYPPRIYAHASNRPWLR